MAKKKKNDRNVNVADSGWSNLRYVFYMLFPLIFLAPYFRGLFFDEELVIAHMFTAVAAGLYFYFNKDAVRFSRNMMDYAGLGMVVAYFLSSFVAYNSRDAVGELLKVLNYFLVFWLVAKLAKNIEDLKKILLTFYISGVGVAIIGIGAAFGTFTYEGAFQDGLISTTIQYHNAGAIYIAATGILGIYLAITMEGFWARVCITAANYIIFITAFGAGSRGALLVAPVAILIQFIGLPRAEKIKFFYNLLAIIIPFTITSKSVLTFGENTAGFHWGMLFLGVLLTFLLQIGVEKLEKIQLKFNKRYLLLTGVILFVALIGLMAVKGTELMPTSIADRAKNINLTDNNVRDRFYFYNDAFKIIKDHPLLGVGGGGWNSIYREYQSYYYNSSEVHSHPIQVWVEGGIIAFASFILLWLGSLISALKVMRSSSASGELKALVWSAFAAALALGMHSSIDFTLSLGAPMIFLWAMFGVVRNSVGQIKEEKDNFLSVKYHADIRKWMGLAVVSLFFLVSCSFWISDLLESKAYAANEEGNLNSAIDDLEQAVVFDPLDGMKRYNLAIMYNQQAYNRKDQTYNQKALNSALEAVEKNQGEIDNYWMLSEMYLINGQLENSIKVAEKGLDKAPFLPDSYINVAKSYADAAAFCLNNGSIDMAKEYARKVLEVPERMKQKNAELDETERQLFKAAPLDQIPVGVTTQINTANEILSQY